MSLCSIDKGKPFHSLMETQVLNISISLVVRSSYPEIFYARLAQEAIQAWKATRWKDTYHEY